MKTGKCHLLTFAGRITSVFLWRFGMVFDACSVQDIRPKTKVPVGPRLVRTPDVLKCTYDGNLPITKNPSAMAWAEPRCFMETEKGPAEPFMPCNHIHVYMAERPSMSGFSSLAVCNNDRHEASFYEVVLALCIKSMLLLFHYKYAEQKPITPFTRHR